MWLNKVGPYHNPQETYAYYSLPYCQPEFEKDLRHKWDGLGSMLEGNELIDSGLHLKFNQNLATKRICDVTLTKESADEFLYAVQNHYWFQLYLDELPIWGMVGELPPDVEGKHTHPHSAATDVHLAPYPSPKDKGKPVCFFSSSHHHQLHHPCRH